MSSVHADRVRDHWYWRPGWSVGRRFYTWHITFAHQPQVAKLADTYRTALDTIPCLDPIPPQWLHLTMQGVGFVDEVDEADVKRIIEATQARCKVLEPFDLSLGAPNVDPESIQIAIEPANPVRQLRSAIRRAIADVWGSERVPEAEGPFNPHMSLAYTNSEASGEPLAAAIQQVSADPVIAHVRGCQLIVLHRDNRMYEWDDYAAVELGSG
ncbi:2'-5' RNA ligase family protein [Micromonospora sp. NPDC003241]